MHASAMNRMVDYLSYFEGSSKTAPITWMYLDERALVSTGVGILLDPLETNKYKVKFYRTNGNGAGAEPATDSDLKAEYELVKSKSEPDPAKPGELRPKAEFANYKAFESITNLRMRDADISTSALDMVKRHDRAVRQYIGPDYDNWPADVQVAVVQMSYAGGLESRRKEGQLFPLLQKRDWFNPRSYTYLTNARSGRDGYLKHNRALEILMLNGWIVDKCREHGSNMVYPAPKDHTALYGLSNRLWVSRWSQETITPDIRTDDIITGGDCTKWLNDWFGRMMRAKLSK